MQSYGGSLMRRLIRPSQEERGQATAWFVAVSILLFAIMAFSVDVGFWFVDRRHAQNQVDAAVLAGVLELPAPAPADGATSPDVQAAAAVAHDWLNRNNRIGQTTVDSKCREDPDEGYTLVEGGFAFGDWDSTVGYKKIRACVRRDGFLLFARILDLTDVQVPAVAAAGLRQLPGRYAIYAMRPGMCSGAANTLFFSGQGTVTLLGEGNSYTESACNDAFHVNGTEVRVITDGEHDVIGGAMGCASDPDLSTCVHPPGDPNTGNIVENFSPDLDDPFGCPPDAPDGLCVDPPPGVFSTTDACNGAPDVTLTSDGTLAEGTYFCPVRIQGNGTEVLLTGDEYVFKAGLTVEGGCDDVDLTDCTSLTSGGNEVLLFFTCSSYPCAGVDPAPFEVKGNFSDEALAANIKKLDIKGHSSYANIAIWVDRTAGGDRRCEGSVDDGTHNLGVDSISFEGTAHIGVDGNIYAVGTTIDMGGGAGAKFTLNGTIVGDRVCFRGQAEYEVQWDASAQAQFEMYLIE
jgi:hypothetical protein